MREVSGSARGLGLSRAPRTTPAWPPLRRARRPARGQRGEIPLSSPTVALRHWGFGAERAGLRAVAACAPECRRLGVARAGGEAFWWAAEAFRGSVSLFLSRATRLLQKCVSKPSEPSGLGWGIQCPALIAMARGECGLTGCALRCGNGV